MRSVAAEAVPVWDRLEGIPDPAENPALFGHRAELDRLAAMHAAGRLHHAILIGGPRGIGKATFAAHLAGHLLRHPDSAGAPGKYREPEAEDRTHGKIAAGAHPNLIWLRRPYDEKNKRFRTELTIDEIFKK